MSEQGRLVVYAPQADAGVFRAEMRNEGGRVGYVFGGTFDDCEERGRRWERSIAACAALPDPERDVAALLKFVEGCASVDDEEGRIAKLLLARIHVDQEPAR